MLDELKTDPLNTAREMNKADLLRLYPLLSQGYWSGAIVSYLRNSRTQQLRYHQPNTEVSAFLMPEAAARTTSSNSIEVGHFQYLTSKATGEAIPLPERLLKSSGLLPGQRVSNPKAWTEVPSI